MFDLAPDEAVQDDPRFDWNVCFSCGPSTEGGLHVKSHLDPDGDGMVATVVVPALFQGPPGVVNGGVLAAPLDCHGSWTASLAYARRAAAEGRDVATISAVTGEYAMRLSRPTPVEVPIDLRSTIDGLDGRKCRVTVEARVDGEVTAVLTGTFFEVDASGY